MSAPRERPILFSAPMVRAILDGRKTQTRRIVPVPEVDFYDGYAPNGDVCWSTRTQPTGTNVIRNRYGAPGDRLWVKETFVVETNRGWGCAVEYPPPFNDGRPIDWHDEPIWGKWWQQAHYRATEPTHDLCDPDEEDDKNIGWKPSIFMPRWASRITLEVTLVRVERLQDIGEADAISEGMHQHDGSPMRELVPGGPSTPTTMVVDARNEFRHLWDQINGDRAPWKSNPWVWVVSFKRVRP